MKRPREKTALKKPNAKADQRARVMATLVRHGIDEPSPRERDAAKGIDSRDWDPPATSKKEKQRSLQAAGECVRVDGVRRCDQCFASCDIMYLYPRSAIGPVYLCPKCRDKTLPRVDEIRLTSPERPHDLNLDTSATSSIRSSTRNRVRPLLRTTTGSTGTRLVQRAGSEALCPSADR